jgi:DnaJ-class molecular chaperone
MEQKKERCPECAGKGLVHVKTAAGTEPMWETCPTCAGTGTVGTVDGPSKVRS